MRRWARALALPPLLPILWATSVPAEVADILVSFRLEGTKIVARGTDGAQLAADALVGTTFAHGTPDTGVYRLRIDRVIDEPAPSGATALYEVSVRAPGRERWDKLCAADPDGRTAAIPVPGFWDKDGGFVRGAEGAFSFACTAGAQAKCVRFGYPPWAIAPNGESLALYHAACVRMLRADYCGDGVAHTVPGARSRYSIEPASMRVPAPATAASRRYGGPTARSASPARVAPSSRAPRSFAAAGASPRSRPQTAPRRRSPHCPAPGSATVRSAP